MSIYPKWSWEVNCKNFAAATKKEANCHDLGFGNSLIWHQKHKEQKKKQNTLHLYLKNFYASKYTIKKMKKPAGQQNGRLGSFKVYFLHRNMKKQALTVWTNFVGASENSQRFTTTKQMLSQEKKSSK